VDAFFNWLSSNPAATTTLVVAFGLIVVAVVAIYLVAFFQGREISIWPPKIGARPESKGKFGPAHPVTEAKPGLSRTAVSTGYYTSDPILKHFALNVSTTRFKIIPLPESVTPSTYGSSYAPTGLFVIYDVPFLLRPTINNPSKQIEHAVIDVQPSLDNTPKIASLVVQVENVSKVHLLQSAGHGYASLAGIQFLGKHIGYIELQFSNDTIQREYFILGKNIREWACGNTGDLVREIDSHSAMPAWISENSSCLLDMMSVIVVDGPKDLSTIRIVGHFEDKHFGLLTPAVRISAITCERLEKS